MTLVCHAVEPFIIYRRRIEARVTTLRNQADLIINLIRVRQPLSLLPG